MLSLELLSLRIIRQYHLILLCICWGLRPEPCSCHHCSEPPGPPRGFLTEPLSCCDPWLSSISSLKAPIWDTRSIRVAVGTSQTSPNSVFFGRFPFWLEGVQLWYPRPALNLHCSQSDLDLVVLLPALTAVSCSARDGTQGFVHTKQSFYQLSYILSSSPSQLCWGHKICATSTWFGNTVP